MWICRDGGRPRGAGASPLLDATAKWFARTDTDCHAVVKV